MQSQRFVQGGEDLWRYDADHCADAFDGYRPHLLCLRL